MLTRRRFLTTLVAVVAAPFVPKPEPLVALDIETATFEPWLAKSYIHAIGYGMSEQRWLQNVAYMRGVQFDNHDLHLRFHRLFHEASNRSHR